MEENGRMLPMIQYIRLGIMGNVPLTGNIIAYCLHKNPRRVPCIKILQNLNDFHAKWMDGKEGVFLTREQLRFLHLARARGRPPDKVQTTCKCTLKNRRGPPHNLSPPCAAQRKRVRKMPVWTQKHGNIIKMVRSPPLKIIKNNKILRRDERWFWRKKC